ncbi:MAG: M56 family metallopeptidase, partial [Terracidiphilus sp.]
IGAATASHPLIQLSAAWSFLIAALWLAASLYRAADLALHSLHLRKLWKTAIPVEIDPASLPRSLGRLSQPIVQICTTGELERPSVIGFFAPRILIPDWLFLRLTSGELDQIVLHETEHLRRRDDWTNLLQKLCLVLFPLNPGLAWIERRLCREREMACDDGVIRVTRAPRAYAACLASLAERGLERRAGMLSLGAWHARPELVRRVHSILRRKHALSPLAARALLGALGCVLLAGAITLARCPRLVAFEPTDGASSAHISPVERSSVERRAVLKEHESSTEELASSEARDFRTENRSVLKGHDFSDAKNNVKASGALAPEGIAPRTTTHVTKSNRAARALATTTSRHSAASPQSRTAAESASVSHAAGTASRSDSGFIVMSTWECFEVTAPERCQKAAGGKASGYNESIRVAGAANVLAAQRITPRITVTRMYLKIYSAGDKGSTWLVIQL